MFKSQLQEYAQKAGLPAPVYDAMKEGPSHGPQFKATVTIHDKVYESPGFFGNLKKAEHAAAEVALSALGKTETGALHESGLCKNLLQEYAQKCKLPLPVYNVVKTGEIHSPTFSATVEIAGAHYNGGKCKTKKEAEIKAARTALVAIYADSGNCPLDDIEDPAVDEPMAPAADDKVPGPKAGAKRKKKFKEGKEGRKLKAKEEQTESVEEVDNKGTVVDDAKEEDGLPCEGANAPTSQVPEQELAGSASDPCANGSAQEQEA